MDGGSQTSDDLCHCQLRDGYQLTQYRRAPPLGAAAGLATKHRPGGAAEIVPTMDGPQRANSAGPVNGHPRSWSRRDAISALFATHAPPRSA